MVAFELHGVEIDRCVICRGIWLDNGELQLIANLAGVAPGELTAAVVNAKGVRGTPRRCPRCRRHLNAIDVGQSSALEIDRCPGGCGLWFDDSEMAAFIAQFDEGEKGAVARYFADWFGRRDAASILADDKGR
jgi:Zn-finger nucleic acid-binding protein